jgi:enamine deaminase RidA (YjgF/YER057c/UK114 family)
MSATRRLASSGSPYEPQLGFSRGVREGQVIAISGTAPLGPDGTTVGPGDPAAQAQRCFEIIRESLEKLGADLSHVTRTRIYLVHIDDWRAVGPVHGELFRNIRPASTVVQVSRFIDSSWLVEIEADAVVPAVVPVMPSGGERS